VLSDSVVYYLPTVARQQELRGAAMKSSPEGMSETPPKGLI